MDTNKPATHWQYLKTNGNDNVASKKIIIIGSGVGGTALAARLAKEGHFVTVLEKNSFSGGRCSLIHHQGHRFDQGPSLLLMREIFEDTFSDLGEKLSDHLNLVQCDPNYVVYFHDGSSVELSSDLPSLLAQVQKFEGNGKEVTENCLDFIKETQVHYNRSVESALKKNYGSLWDLVKISNLGLLFKLHLWDTVYSRAQKYFKSPHMLKAFTFQTMYLGMSPYEAPAPYNLLQYAEIGGGIWYPVGGFNKLVTQLEKIGTNYGAEFIYNADVKRIDVDEGGKVRGVTYSKNNKNEEKEEIEMEADIVVCNADLVYAYNHLLPKTKYGRQLGETSEMTSSSISFYWSMSQIIPQLKTHNVFIGQDYKASFDKIFKEHTLPYEPSFYVNVPSRIDPTAAPPDKDTIVILVPVGHLTRDNSSEEKIRKIVNRAREFVISELEKKLLISNFRSLISHEIVNSPLDWESKFNLWHGSILGLSHSLNQVLYFRPSTRCKEFKNLYFVGASAHPGTGVPVVLCGAKLVADQIKEDSGMRKYCYNRGLEAIIFGLMFISLMILILMFLKEF